MRLSFSINAKVLDDKYVALCLMGGKGRLSADLARESTSSFPLIAMS